MDVPPAAATHRADEVARVFRFHAAAQAEALRDALERAALDEPLKQSLSQLVTRHLRRADEEADRAARAYAAPPAGAAPIARRRTLDDIINQALELAHDFNDGQVAAWLDEHPSAYQPVQEQIALAEAYQRAAAEDVEVIVRAATAAGIAAPHDAELRKSLTVIRGRLGNAADADLRRLREAEQKAAPTAAPRPATKSGAAPSPGPLPPPAPPSPEVEALERMDRLVDAEAHARLTAAGREARAEAEKLLTTPVQRKALDDEMLRWYQAQVPPEDGREGEQPPSGSAPARKRRSPVDPGF